MSRLFVLAVVASVALLAVARCATKPHTVVAMPRHFHAIGSQSLPVSLMTLQLEESFFQKVTADLVDVINQVATQIVVPGENTQHFSFNSFSLSSFDLGAIDITFQPPNQLTVSIANLNLAIPQTHFDVKDKILFIHLSCGGNFWASISNTNINIVMTVETDAQNQLQVVSASANANFGSLNIQHSFSNFFCKIGQDIIQLFIGNLNNKIANLIRQDLPAKIAPVVQNALNKLFDKMTLPIVGQPVVTSDSVAVTINVLPQSGQKVTPPNMSFNSLPNRDIDLVVSASSVNGLLQYAVSKGMLAENRTVPPNLVNTSALQTLLPAAYALCPNCPFVVEIEINTAPSATFGGDGLGLTVVNGIFGLNALNTSTNTIIPLVDFYINCSVALNNFSIGGANQSTVMFALAVPTFSLGLMTSNIGPVNVALLNSLVGFVIQNFLVPDFNKKFKGVTVPPMKGIDIKDLVVGLHGGTLTLGLNIVLPPLKSTHHHRHHNKIGDKQHPHPYRRAHHREGNEEDQQPFLTMTRRHR